MRISALFPRSPFLSRLEYSREYEVEVVLPKLDLFGEYQEQQQALFSALLIYGINL